MATSISGFKWALGRFFEEERSMVMEESIHTQKQVNLWMNTRCTREHLGDALAYMLQLLALRSPLGHCVKQKAGLGGSGQGPARLFFCSFGNAKTCSFQRLAAILWQQWAYSRNGFVGTPPGQNSIKIHDGFSVRCMQKVLKCWELDS